MAFAYGKQKDLQPSEETARLLKQADSLRTLAIFSVFIAATLSAIGQQFQLTMCPKYPLVFRHFCRPNDLHVFATDPE
jgi:hypothetical protein